MALLVGFCSLIIAWKLTIRLCQTRMQISGNSELNNGNNGNVTRIPYLKQFEAYKEYLIRTWTDPESDTPDLIKIWKDRVFPNSDMHDDQEVSSTTAAPGENEGTLNDTAAISKDANDMIN
jgi:hypothetical protein